MKTIRKLKKDKAVVKTAVVLAAVLAANTVYVAVAALAQAVK